MTDWFQFPFGGNGFCGEAALLQIDPAVPRFNSLSAGTGFAAQTQKDSFSVTFATSFNSLSAGTGFAASAPPTFLRYSPPRFNSLSAGTGFAAEVSHGRVFVPIPKGFNSLSAGTGFAASHPGSSPS